MLEEQLESLTNEAFSKMPKEVGQKLKDAISEVKVSQLKQKALKVGDNIKSFELSNIYDESVDLKELFKHEYLLINFFRGGWCPFCSLELKEYERLKSEFKKNDIDIVAISPEVPKYSLKTKEDNSLTFEILSDKNSKLMKEFGIVFTLNDDVKELYNDFGIDIVNNNENSSFEMPVPATYLINKDLQIVYSYIEEDYTKRLEPSRIIDFIKTI